MMLKAIDGYRGRGTIVGADGEHPCLVDYSVFQEMHDSGTVPAQQVQGMKSWYGTAMLEGNDDGFALITTQQDQQPELVLPDGRRALISINRNSMGALAFSGSGEAP